MIYLNEYSLQYAISLCQLKKQYKVHIAVFTKQSMIKQFSKIININLQNKNIIDYINNERYCLIKFINGSVIKMSTPSQSCCGQRCHLLIVDERIKKDVIKKVLMPYETLNYNKTLQTRCITDLINSFENLKQNFPNFKIVINTKNKIAQCEIEKTDIITCLKNNEIIFYEQEI